MNLKYLSFLLLTAFTVTASNIERRAIGLHIINGFTAEERRYWLRNFIKAHEIQTSRFTTEDRRHWLIAFIRWRTLPLNFGWNYFQDLALLVEDLMDIGADLNRKDCIGEPLLTTAAKKGDLKAVTLLLDYGVDVNSTNSNRETALCASIYCDRKEIARLLLERCADPFIGKTLYFAIRRNFMPHWMIPCIGMIEPDSKLANRLAHVCVEIYNLGPEVWYLDSSSPYFDACLDKITNQAKLQVLFQIAFKNWRAPVVQALLERGCSWRQLDLRKIFIGLEKDFFDYMRVYWIFSWILRPPSPAVYARFKGACENTLYDGSAMAEFHKMGMLEGATPDELKAVLKFLKLIRDDDLYAKVSKMCREKDRENSNVTCNIS